MERDEISYNPEKDFYKGIGGELRMKAEGLFKKAKEKGISIEEINIVTLRDSQVDFPGIGTVQLPAFIVTVKGRDIQTQQVIMDGKQIDYYNRYQRYVAQKIDRKNRNKGRQDADMSLTDWERFEIGKDLVEDKEFGTEKTITGACDRVIRKLMGENDWLYPEEARLLDEEFNMVQNNIAKEDTGRTGAQAAEKRATDRQINYLKVRMKNLGLDADNAQVMREVIRQSGFGDIDIGEISTSGMSRIIDGISDIAPKVKNAVSGQGDEAKGGIH